MRERPILFSGAMVRAILAGRKTQTRRVVKPSPGLQSKWASVELLTRCPSCYLCVVEGDLGAQFQHPHAGTTQPYGDVAKDSPLGWFRCPYGKPGDRLWVRETWAPLKRLGSVATITEASYALFRDGGQKFKTGQYFDPAPKYADGAFNSIDWRPSIHMPRWASRILLEVTEVRVERLQGISEADAMAEGVDAVSMADIPRQATMSRRADFAQIWDLINGKRAPWASNPWVWVVEFKAAGRMLDGRTWDELPGAFGEEK